MVFQDYELISTKRVNAQRRGSYVFFNHMFNATGGYNTLFFGGIFGYAFISRLTMAGTVLPAVTKYAMALPTAVIGLCVGTLAFGDFKETLHLLKNVGTYRREFKHYQQDIYG
uniref:Uncharacterized protein n=1 Tax=Strombidium inclinatum TaxID=197538 RepID=A0A7S3MUG2_9SPIT|eukprot:CAMPEP_0170493120 /NCGR_PEP_ID=MMETSP0208-20121228/13393_1 /TAXON_ID=197538 /ORGANISM="Strombidium inclinatum, Strain S3" /LENGTH=112 /DNA_ID=CAMNT_0010768995 /DNA_START=1 /DNA_END=339 /DNA_ORIENTATION=+